ncbi:GYDIA family GHMP kinase [Flavobacterium sp. M31R6]|uniref:GYDIA family GHMP kinase n=1 Tax=Flavobacterium sp. M31R6 TaxID=2739062 RepID=UPI001567EE3F|nr:GYDIA family GHMP kinase [Flavobacterium sp. M31R6]QKJ61602.1 GHMP kinase [Flavobacterium sp. M31R6]
MEKTFYSNGKLLITGEYLVLDGAKALALPTKFGQNLIVEKTGNKEIKWKSHDADGSVWFEDTIPFSEIISTTPFEKESVKNTLITILREAYRLNTDVILKSEGYTVSTRLSFPKKWGLGTSSTLINNIAQWFNINAFTLLKNSFGGSGYDIACAQNDCPILYHLEQGKPIVEKVNFHPTFTENLYFVYLNQKQNSKNAIASYKEKKNNLDDAKEIIDQLTETVLNAKDENTFAQALEKHEKELSSILEIRTAKESLFPDFEGTIKSLGAWGGDFVLVISKENPSPYFISKGFETIIPYIEMIL